MLSSSFSGNDLDRFSRILNVLLLLVEMIAGEAGHVEIVDILRNSADSGIMDIEHMHEGDGEFLLF